LQHRVILVGRDDALQSALESALRQRAATVAAVCPDLASARAEAQSHPGHVHLFIVHLAAEPDLGRLATLTSALPGQPVIVLLPPGADLARMIAAQRAGAAQVVPLPWQAEDFLRALDCIASQFTPPARTSRIIAVCGVSGGCGATTLALNLAYELGQPDPRGEWSSSVSALHSTRSTTGGVAVQSEGCLLVELARQMGTLATYLDIAPPVSTHELLADASKLTVNGIRQALTTVAPGLDVLVGPYLDITPSSFSPRHVYQLIELCRRLAATIVLDVPCAFDDLQFETLALADQVVLVGVQSVSSIRTMKMVRDTLEREEGIRGQRLVINRYEPGLPSFSAPHLAKLLQVPQVWTVANDYPAVMAAVNHGKPLRLAAPHSRVLVDIRALANSLVGGSATLPSEEGGDRLSRALGRGLSGHPAPRAVRVLHIEDDPVQQQVVALHLAGLKEWAFSITVVASEKEAVECFRRQPFDVVLLDYHLAQGNGLGCLLQLRALDPVVPIVVVSGVAQPQVASELLDAGADDFLSKENLSGDRLAHALSTATARAGACKQRAPVDQDTSMARLDTFFDKARKTASARSESELLRSLHDLQESGWPSHFTAGQIQRLVDLVCTEMGRTPAHTELPRRALLALFLRLFGSESKDEG
jgi:pilus assembly protein CpaE